jgi:hypothetical protein
MSHKHYDLSRKRAAVDVYHEVKRRRTEDGWISVRPEELASVAAGGASRRRIFAWLKEDLSIESQEERIENRGKARLLSDDQMRLLVGFAVATRTSLKPVSLHTLLLFCDSYLNIKPSYSTLSRILEGNGFSSQKVMARSSRMASPEVVEAALDSVLEIRSYEFLPHRILLMDETGLWSNVVAPRTFHFLNW